MAQNIVTQTREIAKEIKDSGNLSDLTVEKILEKLMKTELSYEVVKMKKHNYKFLISVIERNIEEFKKADSIKNKDDDQNLNKSIRNIYQKISSIKKVKGKRKIKTPIRLNEEVPGVMFRDMGGVDSILNEVKELIIYPLKYPEAYKKLGVSPARGILFCGPSGCGKTMMAMSVANECGTNFIKISSPEIITGVSGESESKLRDIFAEAKKKEPCILLIDEIDAICGQSDSNSRGMERRILAQLVSCFDDLNFNNFNVVFIGTTSKPETLDKSLRRGGRFDKEILFKHPDTEGREAILKRLMRKIKTDKSVCLSEVAKKTPGFVGADLSLLVKEATKFSLRRSFKNIDELRALGDSIDNSNHNSNHNSNYDNFVSDDEYGNDAIELSLTTTAKEASNVSDNRQERQEDILPLELDSLMQEDLDSAIRVVVPGFKRYGFTSIPKTSWDDIGGLDHLHDEMKQEIVYPILYPGLFERQGLDAPTGVLFYGPPGCGKTLMAKAIANEAKTSFISIKGPELLNSYVGESEKAIRSLFQRAASCAPCIIFFDEIESLVPKRFGSNGSSEVSLRVVTQMLTELDGLDERKGVFVIAATNRPDAIDSAVLRPGRIGRIIHVKMPKTEERKQILLKHLRKIPCERKFEFIPFLLENTEGFSGADCANLIQRAASVALSKFLNSSDGDLKKKVERKIATKRGIEVEFDDFQDALKLVRRSVSDEAEAFYQNMKNSLGNIKN